VVGGVGLVVITRWVNPGPGVRAHARALPSTRHEHRNSSNTIQGHQSRAVEQVVDSTWTADSLSVQGSTRNSRGGWGTEQR